MVLVAVGLIELVVKAFHEACGVEKFLPVCIGVELQLRHAQNCIDDLLIDVDTSRVLGDVLAAVNGIDPSVEEAVTRSVILAGTPRRDK